jgi:hypothetical protein
MAGATSPDFTSRHYTWLVLRLVALITLVVTLASGACADGSHDPFEGCETPEVGAPRSSRCPVLASLDDATGQTTFTVLLPSRLPNGLNLLSGAELWDRQSGDPAKWNGIQFAVTRDSGGGVLISQEAVGGDPPTPETLPSERVGSFDVVFDPNSGWDHPNARFEYAGVFVNFQAVAGGLDERTLRGLIALLEPTD